MIKLLITEQVYNIRCNIIDLLEMWTEKDKVTPAYMNIPGATKKNISKFKNHPIMLDMKQDIKQFAEKVCDYLNSLPCVRRAFIKNESKFSGLSIYIMVKFNKPEDADYLRDYKKSYDIMLRLSDHDDQTLGIEDYCIDMCNKTVDEFKQEAKELMQNHYDTMQQEYTDWQETHTLSDTQHKRNKDWSKRNAIANAKGNKRKNK